MNSNTGLKREEKKKNTGEEEKDTREEMTKHSQNRRMLNRSKNVSFVNLCSASRFLLVFIICRFFSRELCQIFFSVVKARTSSILQHHLSIITKQFRSSLTLRKLYVYFLSAVMSLNQPFDVSFSVL